MIGKKFDDVLRWDRTMIILVERIQIDLHVNLVSILDYREVSNVTLIVRDKRFLTVQFNSSIMRICLITTHRKCVFTLPWY